MASKRDMIIGVNSLTSDNLVSSAINAATVAAGPWNWFGSPSLPSLSRFPFCFHRESNISSSSFFLFLSFYFEGFQSHLSWNTSEFLFKCSAPEQNWPNKLRIYAFVQHLDFFLLFKWHSVSAKKTHGRVWENQETLLLLQKWGDENIQMKLIFCTRNRPIWQEISDFIRAAGYEDRDEDACKTRVHTLVSAYRSYKTNGRRPETGLQRGSWRFSTRSMNFSQKNHVPNRRLW